MLQQIRAKRAHNQDGFTLIELLIAIVVVGVLAAVVIIGVGSVQDKGEKSACTVSQDAVQAAQIVHFANNNGVYPTTFAQMKTAGELALSGSTTIIDVAPGTGNGIQGNGWSFSIASGGGAGPLVLTACPA
jgi:prepilin-type N-terminal cleavage/methylation domain-containing protein